MIFPRDVLSPQFYIYIIHVYILYSMNNNNNNNIPRTYKFIKTEIDQILHRLFFFL